jgi:hypothetical protein
MRKFTIPTTFSSDFIAALSELNQEFSDSYGEISEIYGSFQEGAFNSA